MPPAGSTAWSSRGNVLGPGERRDKAPGSPASPRRATARKAVMHRPSVLGIAGSVRQPSRTTNLVAAVVDAIAVRLGTTGETIELGDRRRVVPRRAAARRHSRPRPRDRRGDRGGRRAGGRHAGLPRLLHGPVQARVRPRPSRGAGRQGRGADRDRRQSAAWAGDGAPAPAAVRLLPRPHHAERGLRDRGRLRPVHADQPDRASSASSGPPTKSPVCTLPSGRISRTARAGSLAAVA